MRLLRQAPNMYELTIVRHEPVAANRLAGSPALAVTAQPRSSSRLEIANGNGIQGMAKRFRQALAARGIKAARLTNARPFGRTDTSIEFRPGFEQQARSLQAAIGGKAALQPADTLTAHTDVRLVLGKDADLTFGRAPGVTGGPMLTSVKSPSPINQ